MTSLVQYWRRCQAARDTVVPGRRPQPPPGVAPKGASPPMQDELTALAERADRLARELDQLDRAATRLTLKIRAPIGVGAAAYILQQWAAAPPERATMTARPMTDAQRELLAHRAAVRSCLPDDANHASATVRRLVDVARYSRLPVPDDVTAAADASSGTPSPCRRGSPRSASSASAAALTLLATSAAWRPATPDRTPARAAPESGPLGGRLASGRARPPGSADPHPSDGGRAPPVSFPPQPRPDAPGPHVDAPAAVPREHRGPVERHHGGDGGVDAAARVLVLFGDARAARVLPQHRVGDVAAQARVACGRQLAVADGLIEPARRRSHARRGLRELAYGDALTVEQLEGARPA